MTGIPSPPLALFVVVLPKAHCRKWLKISRKWLKENLGLCLIEIFSIYSAESGIWWGSETLFKPFFSSRYICEVGFPGCASVKELACQCMPPEEETATHSSILTWRFPWTEEPGGLQSMGPQRVEHDWSNLESTEASEPGNPCPFHHSSRGSPRSAGCGKSFMVHHPVGMSLHGIHGFQMNRSILVFITFKKWVCVSHA